jgi:hypothetical protein
LSGAPRFSGLSDERENRPAGYDAPGGARPAPSRERSTPTRPDPAAFRKWRGFAFAPSRGLSKSAGLSPKKQRKFRKSEGKREGKREGNRGKTAGKPASARFRNRGRRAPGRSFFFRRARDFEFRATRKIFGRRIEKARRDADRDFKGESDFREPEIPRPKGLEITPFAVARAVRGEISSRFPGRIRPVRPG